MAGVKGRSGGPRKNAGGKREGAGRKPAPKVPPVPVVTDNRDTLQLLKDIAFGLIDANATQVRAAIAAVQYEHAKKGDGGKKDERQDAAKAAANRFAPAPAPPRLAAVGGKPV
jgi:phage terminase small subunit